jgi:hypothetical protein
MIENTRRSIPSDHPVRTVLHQLTDRAMKQLDLRDKEIICYVANLLTEFIHCDNLYRLRDDSGKRLEYICDILEQSSHAMSPNLRREFYRYLGDWTLFNLGLFPEQLTYGRRTVSPTYFAQQGRRSYSIIADMENPAQTAVFHKLAEEFSAVRGRAPLDQAVHPRPVLPLHVQRVRCVLKSMFRAGAVHYRTATMKQIQTMRSPHLGFSRQGQGAHVSYGRRQHLCVGRRRRIP